MINRFNLDINAVGMSSVIGGSRQACAAFCAGIKLPQQSMDFEIHEADEDQGQAITVMSLPKSAFAFSGVARFAQNMAEALLDLSNDYNFEQKIPFILMLPDPNERGLEGAWALEEKLETRINLFGSKLIQLVQSILAEKYVNFEFYFIKADHTGLAKALNLFEQLSLKYNTNKSAIGAVDSFIDNETLEFLMNEDKLKSDDNPAGFIPGESSCVCVMSRTNEIAALIECVVEVNELAIDDNEDLIPNSNRYEFLDETSLRNQNSLLISDMNGEHGRAQEWGNMIIRLNQHEIANSQTEIYYPAETFGETGVNAGFIALLIAIHCFQRKLFSNIENVIIVLSDGDNNKDRAVVCLSRS